MHRLHKALARRDQRTGSCVGNVGSRQPRAGGASVSTVLAGFGIGENVNQGEAWGKASSKGLHPLTDHCLDVAIVFRQLLELPWIKGMGQLDDVQRDRLAVVAYLHDFGKCNRGFQAKADPSANDVAGHAYEAVALLELQELWPPSWSELMHAVSQWFADEEQAYQMLLASISHHGRPISLFDFQNYGGIRRARRWWLAVGDYDPLVALDVLARGARQAFPGAFQKGVSPLCADATVQHRFAGLVMLADWIGSDTTFFPFRSSATEERHAVALAASARALSAIGLRLSAVRRPKAFREVFPFIEEPTQLQRALGLPRACGDRPVRGRISRPARAPSPRMRGSTPVAAAAVDRQDAFPAHAGINGNMRFCLTGR
jgi:CRISPR-associated endonuclease/helicase Cas3